MAVNGAGRTPPARWKEGRKRRKKYGAKVRKGERCPLQLQTSCSSSATSNSNTERERDRGAMLRWHPAPFLGRACGQAAGREWVQWGAKMCSLVWHLLLQ